MGKRRRNERMIMPGAAGVDRTHYCWEHNEPLKPVKMYGQGFKFQCKQGCDLDKHQTNLKQRESTQRPR